MLPTKKALSRVKLLFFPGQYYTSSTDQFIGVYFFYHGFVDSNILFLFLIYSFLKLLMKNFKFNTHSCILCEKKISLSSIVFNNKTNLNFKCIFKLNIEKYSIVLFDKINFWYIAKNFINIIFSCKKKLI